MRKYRYIILLAVIIGLSFGQPNIRAYQAEAWSAFLVEPQGAGVYLVIRDNLDSTHWAGAIETTTTVTLPICPRETLILSYSLLITPEISEIADLGDRVAVPGGWFRVGANSDDQGALETLGMPEFLSRRASPMRWAYIDSFEIAKIEASCSLFMSFIGEGGYDEETYWSIDGWAAKTARGWTAPSIAMIDSSLPVRGISYYEAEAFAKWHSADLPTELQWEISARFDVRDVFPWGDDFCPSGSLTANILDASQCAPDPFSGGPGYSEYFNNDLSPTGCYSMGGNIAEWCRDAFDEYDFYVELDPLAPFNLADGQKSVRGGDFTKSNRYVASPLFRTGFAPETRDAHLGVRLAWETGDGVPNDWVSLEFVFDCESPDTVAVISPECLKSQSADTIRFVFTEPVEGEVILIPDYGINNEFIAETLFIITEAGFFAYGDSIGIDISGITDTVENPIGIADTFWFSFCLYEIDFDFAPEAICAPAGCSFEVIATIVNSSADVPLEIDSAIIGGFFEILDFAPGTLPQGDSTSFTIRFDPDTAGTFAETLYIYHSDGVFEEIIPATACDDDTVYFAPSVIELEDVYTAQFWTTQLRFNICEACSLFGLRIISAEWTNGRYFDDNVWINTVMNLDSSAIAVEISYDPSSGLTGLDDDTLTVTFEPVSAVCDKPYTARLIIDITAEDFECVPTPECREIERVRPCDAVMAPESIFFTGICEGTVKIYDRVGRFVIELAPNSMNTAEWKLIDENGHAVPSGIYYWQSGSEHGNIVVVR